MENDLEAKVTIVIPDSHLLVQRRSILNRLCTAVTFPQQPCHPPGSGGCSVLNSTGHFA
jgi:hypothetical protein